MAGQETRSRYYRNCFWFPLISSSTMDDDISYTEKLSQSSNNLGCRNRLRETERQRNAKVSGLCLYSRIKMQILASGCENFLCLFARSKKRGCVIILCLIRTKLVKISTW